LIKSEIRRIIFVGGRRNRSVLHTRRVFCHVFRVISVAFGGLGETGVGEVGLEETGDIADVDRFKFFFGVEGDDVEVEVKEVLGVVVVIHPDVLELKVDLDAVVGQER
jgi:hypothetical protein